MKIVKIIVAAVIVLGLAIWAITSYLGPDDLAKCGSAPSDKSGCQEADAIVAVSGGDTLARADEAIKLYKDGWANVLIFSGAAADKSGPSNALVMKERAIAQGVNATDILLEDQSESTVQNAERISTLFDQYNIKSAILVTSAYH